MEELQRITTYSDFKRELDKTFTGLSEGFVRAGYLLKQARDTDILRESGYKSVTEFAAAEYGLTETYVSRFIAINDRYSEGGYSDRLQERYRGYGMSKLAEMLTLPEPLADAIPPALSREEIREVKREVAEENKITDLEVMLEGQQDTELSLPARAMKQYFHDDPEKYPEMLQALKKDELAEQEEAALDSLAPSGSAVLMVRLQGVGKLMISIQGLDRDIEIQNVRTLERETVAWSMLLDEIFRVYGREALENPEKAWEAAYGESFPGHEQAEAAVEPEMPEEKPEIAPAQVGKAEPIMNEPEQTPEQPEQMPEKPEQEEQEDVLDRSGMERGDQTDGENRRTEEHAGDPEGAGEEPEGQQDDGGQEAEAATEGEADTAGDGEPETEPESCPDVATESQGDIVNTKAEADPDEPGQQNIWQMSEPEKKYREQIMDMAAEVQACIHKAGEEPMTMQEVRRAHAAARKMLTALDRLYDVKEHEIGEIEGQMSLEDMEDRYVSE